MSLEGRQDVSLLPLALNEEPIAIAVMMPNDRAYHALSDSTGSFAAVVLFTIMATIAAGLYLTRYLIQPIKALTGRAEELSLRFAGRPAGRRGDELDSLVASFEAMTSALLSHSDRLARAHKSELQNSLELQRQYAQMRLLRGLAAVANEGGTVESTLERALHEIGAYLDWPLGRVALQQERTADSALPPRSIWFSRDADRFAVFVDACNRTPIMPSPDHLIGRAYLSGTPHWVSDLSRMSEWNRLVEALDAGLQTGIVIPVIARGHVAAFIEFFCDHRVEATNELLELLESVSAELSRVAERQRAERELREREARGEPTGDGRFAHRPDGDDPRYLGPDRVGQRCVCAVLRLFAAGRSRPAGADAAAGAADGCRGDRDDRRIGCTRRAVPGGVRCLHA